MAKPVVKRKYTLGERVYLWEIIKGLGLTWRHFIFNIRASFRPGPHTVPTCWQYPEDRTREISPIFRGAHMLMLDDKGRELCIGCGMCAKACPAKCITVKRGKVPEEAKDKYAAKTFCEEFTIDFLRCIFCGFCEEACPKGAIVLGQGYELAEYTRGECQITKDRLLENYHTAKAEGKLKPPKKPVPVAGAAEKPAAKKGAAPKKAAGAQAKTAKAKAAAPKKAAESEEKAKAKKPEAKKQEEKSEKGE